MDPAPSLAKKITKRVRTISGISFIQGRLFFGIMSAVSGGEQFQNAVYVGINLQDILYGIEAVLYLKTMCRLLAHEGTRKKSDVFYAIFTSVMLFIITIWMSTQAMFGQHMWLLDTDFTGGSNAYWAEDISDWYRVLVTVAVIVLQLMTDALMIYRCWIVWNNYRFIIVPSILWIGTLALGSVVGWNSTATGGFFFRKVGAQLCLAYYSISVLSTAMLTAMICYRMIWHGREIRTHLGHEFASPYFGILALVVESVLPYTLASMAFLVALGVGSQLLTVFGYVHISMMVTCWLLYITPDVDSTCGFGGSVDGRNG
ncbi:hypothetical protein JVU11DRAFT_1166 [Chiua virens]|nr:hypothetical protein JVU11DRAFT_1166 [Chiua virens]